jgi:hypothetical protein
MGLPASREVAELLLSAKANALGHNSVGIGARRLLNVLLVTSLVLSVVAGFTGLRDILSKTCIGAISLTAAIATTVVIFALTTLKPEKHLRAQAEYEGIYIEALGSDDGTAEGEERFEKCWNDFQRVEKQTDLDGIPLSRRQVNKYMNMARAELPSQYR